VKQIMGLSLGLEGLTLGIPAWAQFGDPLPSEVLDASISAEILNQPVTTPFGRPGLLRDSSRPVYVVTHQQIREQGARTAQEVSVYLPGSTHFPSPSAVQNTHNLLLDLSWLWTQEKGSLQARVFFDDLNYRFSAPETQGSRNVGRTVQINLRGQF
jgi:hypothetical protein